MRVAPQLREHSPAEVLEADAAVVVALVHDLRRRQDLDAHRLDAACRLEHEGVGRRRGLPAR